MTAGFADPAWEQRVDACLLLVLRDARRGTLDADWRSARSAAAALARRTAISNPMHALADLAILLGRRTAVVEAELDIVAMRELNELPLMEWEPSAAAVGKPALTAWYGTAEALNARGEKRGDLSTCDALWRSHQLAESFEAGLVASGDGIDWIAHSRERLNYFMVVACCADAHAALATANLIQLTDPAYRARQEELPDYWRN